MNHHEGINMSHALFPNKVKKDYWFKEPWMILVIGGPFFVVVACMFTINLAFNGADQVVAKDYYSQGLMINTNLMRDAKARELNLKAQLQIDFTANTINMRLSSKQIMPDTVQLSLASSGAANGSVEEIIRRLPMHQTSAGNYVGALKSEERLNLTSTSLYHAKLETNEWRLTGDWYHPQKQALELVPAK